MSTKAKITPKPKFDIEIDDILYEDCVMESRWKGMACFVTEYQKEIIVEWSFDAFEMLFGRIFEKDGCDSKSKSVNIIYHKKD